MSATDDDQALPGHARVVCVGRKTKGTRVKLIQPVSKLRQILTFEIRKGVYSLAEAGQQSLLYFI